MNWYADQRAIWIFEMLKIYGFVNRRHLCAKFGCSPQSASNDLTSFQKTNSDWVSYDNRRKCYVSLTTGEDE